MSKYLLDVREPIDFLERLPIVYIGNTRLPGIPKRHIVAMTPEWYENPTLPCGLDLSAIVNQWHYRRKNRDFYLEAYIRGMAGIPQERLLYLSVIEKNITKMNDRYRNKKNIKQHFYPSPYLNKSM